MDRNSEDGFVVITASGNFLAKSGKGSMRWAWTPDEATVFATREEALRCAEAFGLAADGELKNDDDAVRPYAQTVRWFESDDPEFDWGD